MVFIRNNLIALTLVLGMFFRADIKRFLVDKNNYLVELAHYIVLNPVRAGMVRSVRDWRWSSYRATAGLVVVPEWLEVDWVLAAFGKQKRKAIELYKQFVSEGKN